MCIFGGRSTPIAKKEKKRRKKRYRTRGSYDRTTFYAQVTLCNIHEPTKEIYTIKMWNVALDLNNVCDKQNFTI